MADVKIVRLWVQRIGSAKLGRLVLSSTQHMYSSAAVHTGGHWSLVQLRRSLYLCLQFCEEWDVCYAGAIDLTINYCRSLVRFATLTLSRLQFEFWVWVEFNAPTRHSIGHFGGGLHSQSLDWYWQTKQTRLKHLVSTAVALRRR